MKSVKSFRIDDLLTNNNNNNERKETIPENLNASSGKCINSVGTKRTLCIEDSSSSSSSGESTCSSPKSRQTTELKKEAIVIGPKIGLVGHRETTAKSEFRGGIGNGNETRPTIPAAYYQALASASYPYGHEGASKTVPYYLPYTLESYKLNLQHSHAMPSHHSHATAQHAPPSFPILSTIPPGYLPPRADFAAYHGVLGQLAAKQIGIGTGFLDKRSFIQERLQYPLFSLNRSLYSATCKRKGGQIRFNNSQTAQLEKAFLQQKYLNAHDRKKLAHSLGLSDRQVKTWFQNRRAKLRKSKSGSGGETEESGSGSPQDLRTVRLLQYESDRYERPPGVKTD